MYAPHGFGFLCIAHHNEEFLPRNVNRHVRTSTVRIGTWTVLQAVQTARAARPGYTKAGIIGLQDLGTTTGADGAVSWTRRPQGRGRPGAQARVYVSLAQLFLIFLKIGAVLYGSGYVLLAFLRNDLVNRTGWLTDQQLL